MKTTETTKPSKANKPTEPNYWPLSKAEEEFFLRVQARARAWLKAQGLTAVRR